MIIKKLVYKLKKNSENFFHRLELILEKYKTQISTPPFAYNLEINISTLHRFFPGIVFDFNLNVQLFQNNYK